jgi:YVTN family beta-propeller protein
MLLLLLLTNPWHAANADTTAGAPNAFAYITNASDDNVSVIDTATNTVVTTIGVGENPLGVTVNPSGTRVYVGNYSGPDFNPVGSVSVIDTATNAVIHSMPTGEGTYGLAVNPAGTRLYVTNQESDNVNVFDTGTNQLLATVAVGQDPRGVVVNPSGTRVYVANNGSDSVSVIDSATNLLVTSVAVANSPYGVAVNPSGTRVYVTRGTSGIAFVSVIDTATNTVVGTIDVGGPQTGIAINASGTRAYVAVTGSNTVRVVDLASNTSIATVAVGNAPHGISVNLSGSHVYVSNLVSNNVSVIDTSSNTVVATVAVGTFPYAFGTFIAEQPEVPPPTWVHLGPAPAHDGQVEGINNRPVTGAINAVVAHPSNADILYVAAVNGGIWRTSNATAASPTWTRLTDGQSSNSIRALAADPTVANFQTLAAGAGRNSSLAGIGGAQIGMLRSTDGGDSWTVLDGGGTLTDRNITAVAARGATLLAATTTGLFRSTNTGAAFTAISGAAGTGLPSGTVTDMVGDPSNNAVFYAVALGDTRGIYGSIDTGATWTKVSNATVDTAIGSAGRVRLATGNSTQLFAAVVTNGLLSAVFRFTPSNSAWTSMGVPFTIEQDGAQFGAHPGGQGDLHLSIAADPTNNSIVYIGGDRQPCFSEAGTFTDCWPNSLGANDYSGRLFRGTVGSNPVWTAMTHSGAGNNSSPHADSRGMAFDANGDLLEVDDGGIYKRTVPRTGTGVWLSLNGDLAVTEHHSISYDSLSDRVFGGTQDVGTVRQVDASRVFASVSLGDGGDTAIDNLSSASTSTRYTSFLSLGSFRRQVFDAAGDLQSETFPALLPLGGDPFMNAFNRGYAPLAVNAVNGLRLVFLVDNGVYESTDQGATVSRIAIQFGNAFVGDPVVYGVPGNAEFLYFGAGPGLVLRTTAGAAPTQRSSLSDTVVDVAADPATPTRLFAMTGSTVHLSTDSASSFSDITGNLASLSPGRLRTMAFVSRIASNLLVVGTDRGAFAAPAPNFNTWARLGQGLPNALVFELEYNATRDVLLAGMLGRGAWRLNAPAFGTQGNDIFRNGFEPEAAVKE